MGTMATFLSFFGPLLVLEGMLLGWRARARGGYAFPSASPARINLSCAIMTLLILFAWPVAIILVLTFMVTTGKKG